MNQLIRIYHSKITNGPYQNLGGPPHSPLSEGEKIAVVFENESLHGGKLFSVFYIRNENYSSGDAISSFSISIKPEFTEHLDVAEIEYISSINTILMIPNYISKNTVHPPITYDGYFVDTYPEKIEDYVNYEEVKPGTIFVDVPLFPGDFLPFVMALEIKAPIPTLFDLPLSVKIITGVV